MQPGNPDAVYNLGNVFKDAERWDEAISCYEKTLGLRAEYPEALNNLGVCLNEVERYEHSEIVLRRAVSLQPGFAGAWLNLGNTSREKGDVEEAIASYRKAIEVKPDFADAYRNLATCVHEESEINDAISLYTSALEADDQVSDCRFHLCMAGVENLAHGFVALQSELERLSQCSGDLLQGDLLFLRCLFDFSVRRGMHFELSKGLDQEDFLPETFSPRYSGALDNLFEKYGLCRESSLPRWLVFKDLSKGMLVLSDCLESLRVKGAPLAECWKVLKDYQLSLASLSVVDLPTQDQLFVKEEDFDEILWLRAERFQFPDVSAALSLRESLLKKSSLPAASKQDQSEFFRKAHLLDAQKFYMTDEDPCFHGVSELYRVHGLIASTIKEIKSLQNVVDLGYYSCGSFNVGLKADLKRYCVEPARHHAVWVAESGIAEVVPDVPERCVRSFDEYLSRLEAVALDDSGSTAAVISFILQLFEYEQCVEILQRVKRFASHLVITDDILNEESEESILRLLSAGKRINLCHNYQRLLSDAGWLIEKKWYFHGVRYASGIIVARAA